LPLPETMSRIFINSIFVIIISLFFTSFGSCTLFKPLSLRAANNNDSLGKIENPGLSQFNGDYEIVTADSNSFRLDYALTYRSLFDLKKLPNKNDHINLQAIDGKHVKATLFAGDRIVKTKTLKGRIINNHFEFHTTHFSLAYVFIVYRQQSNRLALSKEGDLYLDTNSGGIGFLLILPVPLSGSSMDSYNLKFKRK
jgi:hypothetical protein